MAADGDKKSAGVEVAFGAPGLADLPFDILRIIVWNERLSQAHVAALRLTCRALVVVATTRLFYRIAISKLNTDREAFIAICNSPNLACHVHEVEWLEISYDVNLFDRIGHQLPDSLIGDQRPDDLPPLLNFFQDQAEQSFWMFNIPPFPGNFPAAATAAARQTAVATFRDPFLAAVDMLPNLHTFISRPMSSDRVVNPRSEYEMTASLFQSFQIYAEPPAAPQTNDGLFCFLIPAMNRPSSLVTRLRWADEFPGFSYCRPLPPSAFERLRSLELCFAPSLLITDAHIHDLEAACIRAVPSLRHLRLCMEHDHCDSITEVERMILGSGLALAPGCNLRSLALVDVTCEADVWHSVIEANAHSLRHLYLDSMCVKTQSIRWMATLHNLQLDTLQIVDECANEDCHSACRDSCSCRSQISCDMFVHESMKMEDVRLAQSRVVTKGHTYLDSDSNSDVDSDDSGGSSELSSGSAPTWAWVCARNTTRPWPAMVCIQVPRSHPQGHATQVWKFTTRSGEIAYGDEPLEWFEDWDPEEGDVAEPTPYCLALGEYCDGARVSEDWLVANLAQDSELLEDSELPEGAFQYDIDEDPTIDQFPESYVYQVSYACFTRSRIILGLSDISAGSQLPAI